VLYRLSKLITRAGAQMTPAVRKGGHATTARTDTPCILAEWHPATAHAEALIEHALAAGFTGAILAADLRKLHQEMCRARGWLPRRWNPVAHQLALKTTRGKKVYAWVDGHRRRIHLLHPVTDLSGDARAADRRPRLSCIEGSVVGA
jgi:hypothetical protein